MKKHVNITFLVLFFCIYSFKAQIKNTNNIKGNTKLNVNYKDFIINENKIYSITENDSLIVWNVINIKIEIIIPNIRFIVKNKDDKIFLINKNGEIQSFEKDKKLKVIDKIENPIYSFFIDKENNFIVCTKKGIYYKKTYSIPTENDSLGNYCCIYNRSNFDKDSDGKPFVMYRASYRFLDSSNRMWLHCNNGEFGTSTYFFDLKNRTFKEDEYLSVGSYDLNEKDINEYYKLFKLKYPNKIKITEKDTLYKFPYQLPIYNGIKGIAEDESGNICISQSLQHFSLDGNITCISQNDSEGFYKSDIKMNNILDRKKDKSLDILLEYVGPITYNKFDKSFYYYSSSGFYKIIKNEDNNYSKKLIIKPNLSWEAGLAMSVGYQMNIIKFEFINKNEFIFLTANNGIGFFNGSIIRYFK